MYISTSRLPASWRTSRSAPPSTSLAACEPFMRSGVRHPGMFAATVHLTHSPHGRAQLASLYPMRQGGARTGRRRLPREEEREVEEEAEHGGVGEGGKERV